MAVWSAKPLDWTLRPASPRENGEIRVTGRGSAWPGGGAALVSTAGFPASDSLGLTQISKTCLFVIALIFGWLATHWLQERTRWAADVWVKAALWGPRDRRGCRGRASSLPEQKSVIPAFPQQRLSAWAGSLKTMTADAQLPFTSEPRLWCMGTIDKVAFILQDLIKHWIPRNSLEKCFS